MRSTPAGGRRLGERRGGHDLLPVVVRAFADPVHEIERRLATVERRGTRGRIPHVTLDPVEPGLARRRAPRLASSTARATPARRAPAARRRRRTPSRRSGGAIAQRWSNRLSGAPNGNSRAATPLSLMQSSPGRAQTVSSPSLPPRETRLIICFGMVAWPMRRGKIVFGERKVARPRAPRQAKSKSDPGLR